MAIPIGFSADEITDVGKDTGSRVVPNHGSSLRGTIINNCVQIEVGDREHSHLLTPGRKMLFQLAQHRSCARAPLAAVARQDRNDGRAGSAASVGFER